MQEIQVLSLDREDTREKGNQPTPVFLLGEFQDRGAWHHIPWGCNESDTTEQLTLSLFHAIDIMTLKYEKNRDLPGSPAPPVQGLWVQSLVGE